MKTVLKKGLMFLALISYTSEDSEMGGAHVRFSAHVIPTNDLNSLNKLKASLQGKVKQKIPRETCAVANVFDVGRSQFLINFFGALTSSGKLVVEESLSSFANYLYYKGVAAGRRETAKK